MLTALLLVGVSLLAILSLMLLIKGEKMARKTVSVRKLIESVNQLNRSTAVSPEMREGWNTLLEQVLSEANAHAGFNYYSAEQLAAEKIYQPPGVIINHEDPSKNQFPDVSRRFYYIHKDL
jgi:hypothetical protein